MKRTIFLARFLVVTLVLGLQLYGSPLSSVKLTQAQSPALSLITPYYGTKAIRSYFDHKYPTYTGDPNYTNNIFVRYDGQQWTSNDSIDTCSNGVNCYDGHNGLDIAMEYEDVLAAADGIIWVSGWSDFSCHNCLYGLEIKIKHTVNGQVYSSRYGHLTTLAVHPGQIVKAGQVIGTSGSTGASTGPHLHFDVSVCYNSSNNCQYDSDYRPIDPFGWEPTPGAPVQVDPWASYATSWCMWGDSQFDNICNSGEVSHPIQLPFYGDEIIVDDTTNNTTGFSKGFNGLWNNPCTGIDPGCREWWETQSVGYNGGHTYRTITDGLAGNYNIEDNWAKWQPQGLTPGDYEIFVWVPEYLGYSSDTFTWQANIAVMDTTGIASRMIVDEYNSPGQAYDPRNKWLSLGIHSLNADSYVYLTDGGESYNHCPNGYPTYGHIWCRVAADAVRFVQIKYQTFLPYLRKSAELIINGGFETGDNSSWVANRSNNPDPIVLQYSGGYGARLGRYNNNVDELYQTISIPANITSANFVYSVWVYSEDSSLIAYDQLQATIRDQNGNFLMAPDIFTNISPRGQWIDMSHDLSAFAGQTIQIYFYMTTDSSYRTDIWVDNVSLFVG